MEKNFLVENSKDEEGCLNSITNTSLIKAAAETLLEIKKQCENNTTTTTTSKTNTVRISHATNRQFNDSKSGNASPSRMVSLLNENDNIISDQTSSMDNSLLPEHLGDFKLSQSKMNHEHELKSNVLEYNNESKLKTVRNNSYMGDDNSDDEIDANSDMQNDTKNNYDMINDDDEEEKNVLRQIQNNDDTDDGKIIIITISIKNPLKFVIKK